MITSTNLSMLRNLEHFQVMLNILGYARAEDLETLKLTAPVEKLEAGMKIYDDLLVFQRGSDLSVKLSQADANRDQALRSLLGLIKAYLHFPEEYKADAAYKLYRLFEKYGTRIDKLPFLQESGMLVNLLQDLELEEYKSAVTTLHAGDWAERLKETSQAFDELFSSREADNSTKVAGQVKAQRQEVQSLFEQLAMTVNAFEIAYDAALYAPLAGKINEAVTYARQQVARRGPRSATKAAGGATE